MSLFAVGRGSLPRRAAAQLVHTSARVAAAPSRPSIQAIAEVRRAVPGTSLVKAREALAASRQPDAPDSDNVSAAIAWLDQHRAEDGAKREAKVAQRVTAEGSIAVCTLSDGLASGARAAIIELNCETDFVARNELFGQLTRDIAHTAAWFPLIAEVHAKPLCDLPVDALLDCPVVPYEVAADAAGTAEVPTVREAITRVVARLGEKIALTRAAALVPDLTPGQALVAGSFAHGTAAQPPAVSGAAAAFASGRVASLLAISAGGHVAQSPSAELAAATRALTRSLARQAAGLPTTSIDPAPGAEDAEPSTALHAQPFAMLLPAAQLDAHAANDSVLVALQTWSAAHAGVKDAVRVKALRRWEVGEHAERPEAPSFADEVKKAAGL